MNKKLIVILVVVLVIIALLIAGACVFFWAYGPKHFINNYFDKIEKGEEFVLEDVYEDFILEDYEDYYVDVENEWKDAENMKYYIDKDEAWRQEVTVTEDEDGDEIEEVTKFKPFYQWMASNYRAWVRVTTDTGMEIYVLEFKRSTDDEWNIFSYWTKPWKMYDIWYEDEYEDYVSFDEDEWDDDFFEIDLSDTEDVVEEDEEAEEESTEEEATEEEATEEVVE